MPAPTIGNALPMTLAGASIARPKHGRDKPLPYDSQKHAVCRSSLVISHQVLRSMA